MAGLSSRFKKAGFELPKYMLEAKGMTLFEHSLRSFEKFFNTESFLFIALDVHDTERFIVEQCEKLSISDYKVVVLDGPTRGQAETVYLGLQALSSSIDESITIFNIDTFRPGFTYPSDFNCEDVDGYLETFIGSGKNWSNVLPAFSGSNVVTMTAEKQEISEFCCTGLYYFKSYQVFMNLFEKIQCHDLSLMQGGEFYIAPMYNDLIEQGADVRFTTVSAKDVIFCGVPDEYYQFCNAT